MIKKISKEEWNSIEKPSEEVNVKAVDSDIIYIINGLYCLCQTENECNNIIVFTKENYSVKHMSAAGIFFIILNKEYGINYIRVEGNKRRYKTLLSIMDGYISQEPSQKRNIFYIDINNGMYSIEKFLLRKFSLLTS